MADNLPCPGCGTPMMFMGYATYYDGRYSTWECVKDGTEVASKEN